MTQISEFAARVARAHGLPLRVQALFALALAAVLPLSFAFVLDGRLAAGGETQRIFFEYMARPIVILGFEFHFYFLFVLALFGIGIGLAGIYIDHIFIKPLRTFSAWLDETRAAGFEQVPVMPEFGSRDISRLGQAVAAVLAYSTSTHSVNKSLSNQQTELLTIAAHQLRTPLTGLKWAFTALAAPETDAATRALRHNQIEATLQRIGLIVDNIIASANISGGSHGYVYSMVDIVPIIERQIEDLRLISDEHGVTVEFKHDGVMPKTYVDEYRMSTAMYNVIENAVEYTPQGGTVTVSLSPVNDAIEFSVLDTGIGISDSEMPKLFTKFFRGASAKHMRPNGSGLGLYLVKIVAAAHGSNISIQSTEGRGTRVAFLIPCRKEAISAASR